LGSNIGGLNIGHWVVLILDIGWSWYRTLGGLNIGHWVVLILDIGWS